MDRWLALIATIVGTVGMMAVSGRVLVALVAWRNNMRRRLFEFADASAKGVRNGC